MPKVILASLAALSLAATATKLSPREQAVALAGAGIVIQGGAQLERVADGLQRPWSLAFTPEDDVLVTEKYRGLRIVRDGRLLPEPVAGGPTGVFAEADSSRDKRIRDVRVGPDGFVYLLTDEDEAELLRLRPVN